MTTASVRQSLNLVGRSASIREFVRLHNQLIPGDITFPLSLRALIGALKPGRIGRKVISLDLLQRKFDEFFNDRERPLFQVRLDGPRNQKGASTLFVLFDDPVTSYNREKPFIKKELAGPGEVLEFPGIIHGTHKFRFSDVNSDGLTVNIVEGQPAGIKVVLHFETGGEVEMENEGIANFDFTSFKITLNFEFGSKGGKVDLLGWIDEIETAIDSAKIDFIDVVNSNTGIKAPFRGGVFRGVGKVMDAAKDDLRSNLVKQFIIVDVSANAGGLIGDVSSDIEGGLTTRIFDALKKDENRNALNEKFSPWLVGGDFNVLSIANDEQALTIEYLVPLGQPEPFPENPQPPLDQERLANIDHIVVLMMENRSFDHMLGYLSKDGGRADLDGLHGGEKNHFKGRDFPSFALPKTVFLEGPCHEHDCVANQVNGGKLDGFVADYAHHRKQDGVDPGEVMGHYTKDQLPVYDFLAREFLICQRWFASHPGPTFPNRFYTLTGRLNRDADGRFEFDNPHSADFIPSISRTIFDHLTEHGVSWHYYEQGYCFLRMFERYTVDDEFIVDFRHQEKGFRANAMAGTLPSVSFIDPDFIDLPPGNDDGPPADIANGQSLVGEVVDAVMNGKGWKKTLLVITYDEHGGFFDHVPPPAAIPVSTINEYGVRVPTFIVSPWVDRGKVSNTVFDHTSIAKTIARRFMSANPPDMGERMAAANDLSMELNELPRATEASFTLPPAPAQKPGVAIPAKPDAKDDQHFKGILNTMRARRPIHT